MSSIIRHSVLKQKAKQLKREKSIKLHQARDFIAIEYGFSNYKHYLNVSNSNKLQLEEDKKLLLQKILLGRDIQEKTKLAIVCLEKYTLSFSEFYEVILQLKSPKSGFDGYDIFDIALELENPSLFDSMCKKFKLEECAYSLLYHEATVGYIDCGSEYEFYIFNELSISNISYEINGDYLHLDGDIEITCEFEHEVPEELKGEPHFQDRKWEGYFTISVDKSKKLEIIDVATGEI